MSAILSLRLTQAFTLLPWLAGVELTGLASAMAEPAPRPLPSFVDGRRLPDLDIEPRKPDVPVERDTQEGGARAAADEARQAATEARRLADAAKRRADEEHRLAANAPAPKPLPRTAAPLAPSATTAPCGSAGHSTSPLPGGLLNIAIDSPCRKGQKVWIGYGSFVFVRGLDAAGRLAFPLDLFLGADQPVRVTFADGTAQAIAVVGDDLAKVSKVAITWKSPVDLNLHALENASLLGGEGDIWSGMPSNAAAAAKRSAASGRGAGFLSTSDDGSLEGDKIEVYTFLHHPDQTSGTVAMALDYASRGSTPGGEACASGPLAEVAFETATLEHGGRLVREAGLIQAAKCGSPLPETVRYLRWTVPDLKIRR